MFKLISFFYFLIFISSSFAQVDTSSSLLLRSGGLVEDSDLEDTWYVKKRENTSRIQKSKVTSSKTTRKLQTKAEKSILKKEKTTVASAVSEEPINEASNEEIIGQVRDLVLGGSEMDIVYLKNKLHSRDPKKNLIQINIAPTYYYNESLSNSWFRRYRSHGPGFNAGAKVWFTPMFGLDADYHTSLSGDVAASSSDSSRDTVDHQRLLIGMNFRKFFGYSLRAPSLIVGLKYYENQFLVSKNAAERPRLNTTGVELSISAILPKTKTSSWLVSASISPGLTHDEESTGFSLKSGSSNKTNRVGFSIGHKFLMDRYSQIYWKLDHHVEKSLYKGASNTNDPLLGSAVSGVYVNNSLTMFSLGFLWGN